MAPEKSSIGGDGAPTCGQLAATLAAYEERHLPRGTKGLALAAPMRQSELKMRQWRVLEADTAFPVALLKSSALTHNAKWMRDYCKHFNVQIAPHGKTTMSPQLFARQLDGGAWGITLATATQVLTAYGFGVRRILLANQLVAPAEIRVLAELLRDDPTFELYVVVDSDAGIDRLAAGLDAAGPSRPLPVLVELGLPSGRSGCRSDREAQILARKINSKPALMLAGVEGYEGLLVGPNRAEDLSAVDGFLDRLLRFTVELDGQSLFRGRDILLSAGGTAYFDRVAEAMLRFAPLSRPLVPILRSGCYLTHDHGFYRHLLAEMAARQPLLFANLPAGGLKPALEVWSMVQSHPEPTLAILTMGKRDVSYDFDLPLPMWWHRPGSARQPQVLSADCKIDKINDQHAYLRLPAEFGHQVRVGDLIGCGISHPCTTFDKWPLLLEVDDGYRVTGAVNTVF
jgi:D-serine dehydratase